MAAAALPVVGGVIGGLFQRGAQKSALQSQERARQEAMTYQRQRDAQRAASARRAMDVYKNNWQAWFQRYGKEGINRYGMPAGIDVTKLQRPGVPAATPQAGGVGALPNPTPLAAAPAAPAGAPATLGQMATGMRPGRRRIGRF